MKPRLVRAVTTALLLCASPLALVDAHVTRPSSTSTAVATAVDPLPAAATAAEQASLLSANARHLHQLRAQTIAAAVVEASSPPTAVPPATPATSPSSPKGSLDWLSSTWQLLRSSLHLGSQTAPPIPRTQRARQHYIHRLDAVPGGPSSDSSTTTTPDEQPITPTIRQRDGTTYNQPPTTILPARLVASLADVGDNAHYVATFLFGRSRASTAALPDTSSLTIRLLVDTGTSDLILFNKTHCVASTISCANNVRSPSFAPATSVQNHASFGVTIDGETYQSGDLQQGTRGGQIGTDLLTMPVRVVGTSQTEYRIQVTHVFVTDNTITATPANYWNYDPTDSMTYTLVNNQYYDRTDGVLGLGGIVGSNVASSFGDAITGFQTLLADASPTFSLDFANGQLLLGGINEAYRSRLLWSDGPVGSVMPLAYHSFRLYRLSICGVNLFQNLTSSWHALVDSGSSCLGLPAEFFDMVVSWLPVRCVVGKYDRLAHICYLTADVWPVLPTVSFRMADLGPDLYIDLAQLLFAQNANLRLCLHRLDSITGGPTPTNAIVIGGRVLKQLFAAFVVDGTGASGGGSRVAFAQADPAQGESRVQCATRVRCSGMEVHYDPLNVCLPPPCSDYYFFDYDPSSKECELSAGFHILCGLLIGLFILAELFLNEAVIYLSGKVQKEGIVAGN